MKSMFAAALLAALSTAHADVLTLPEAATVDIALPVKGSSMAQVSHQFGEPRVRHKPAGGDTPKHPPITRWDYDGFSVFFENQHVVDAVRPDAPAPIAHREELAPPTP